MILLDGMPDPSADGRGYERTAIDMIRRYVARSDGRAFVLFTSYEMMQARGGCPDRRGCPNKTWPFIARPTECRGARCWSCSKIIPRSVLFGVDSFWQGVDVPGDALAERDYHAAAVQRARPAAVGGPPGGHSASGGNPFRDYQLPEAILKLKQGFGRLIRTQRDTGMVVILDPRMRTKPYGRLFLASLPNCRQVVEAVDSDHS